MYMGIHSYILSEKYNFTLARLLCSPRTAAVMIRGTNGEKCLINKLPKNNHD